MRRYLFPAILALTLHGLLLGIAVPHRPAKPPRLPGIPVEIAIRQPAPKPVAAKKETAPKPVAKPTQAPPPPLKEEKKPVPRPRPPKQAISKKPAAIKNAALVAPKKESKIEKKKEEPQPAPPAPPSPADAPAEEPSPAAASAAATRSAPAQPILRRLAVPAYQHNRQPEYPPMARRRGYSGTVMLKVLVDAQGRVADLTVEQSSGHRILDRAALKAVRQWLFSPAIEDAIPISMWVSVPITFRLQDQ